MNNDSAKPSLKIDAMVFWFVVLTALPVLGWHFGYTTGFEDGRNGANGVCRIVCGERK